MANLSYKTFIFPNDPESYREVISREPVYITEAGVSYFNGMSDMRRVITGEGTFCGADAYAQFKLLQKLGEDGAPGNLEHPIWGIRYCYLTKLELKQEPRENCVRYSFEFTQALTNGEVPK